jgi:hypothetical protein
MSRSESRDAAEVEVAVVPEEPLARRDRGADGISLGLRAEPVGFAAREQRERQAERKR